MKFERVARSVFGSPIGLSVECRYENLRMAALGEVVRPEARSGLLIFLRGGMWSWVQSLTATIFPEHPTRSPLVSRIVKDPDKALIGIFAGMASEYIKRRVN